MATRIKGTHNVSVAFHSEWTPGLLSTRSGGMTCITHLTPDQAIELGAALTKWGQENQGGDDSACEEAS